jgi:hypothetical protein
MATDNRTIINDCEDNTGWAGDDTANAISDTGSFIEGSGALSTQLSNADEQMHTTEDTVATGTFSLDWSDSTVYMNIKDNLGNTFANGGYQFVLGDAADLIGYFVGGNDAIGMISQFYFAAFKLDVSEVVATPGTVDVDFTEFAGTEGGLTHTAVTRIGYGSLHLAKAVGSVDNVIMDGFYYIANDSYALTIDAGTSGTPETMSDVFTDDESGGWNLVANPLGSLYQFFGPTEWGDTGTANSYFTADGEQWFWIGDNSGGKAVGATHFPFRIIGNGTGTNSFVIDNVVIVNTGTGAEFDCSNGDMDILEIDGCSISGLASLNAPSSGGTSRFLTNTIISDSGQVTHNGADMSGSSVLLSTVAADTGALLFNETTDPDTVMDGMTFSKGANSHHAIDFGTNVDGTSTSGEITLRNCTFNGFGTTEDGDDAALRFLDTGGSLNVNLVGCTVDGAAATSTNLFKDDAAGIAVTLVFDPVTVSCNVKDDAGGNLQNARVFMEASDGTGDYPFQDSVTITRSGSTASVSHTAHGMLDGDKVHINGANEYEYNGVFAITNVTTNAYDYTVTDRTNNILRSEVFNVTWGQSNSTVNADATSGPPKFAPGTADRLIDDNGGGSAVVILTQNFTVSTSTQYTISVWAKADGLDWLSLEVTNIAAQTIEAYFDLTNGVIGATTGADNDSEAIEAHPYGWYRCSVTFTTDVADAAGTVILGVAEADNDKIVDRDNTSSIFLFGAQLENGSTTTPYIVTAGGTVTSPATPATGTITATGVALEGLTNASGDITTSRTYGANTPVQGFVRKSSSSPRFKTFSLAGNTISNSTGLALNVRLVSDE